MKSTLHHKIYIKSLLCAIIAAGLSLCAPLVRAFPLEHYASSSALAQGRWVKIAVNATGMHLVPESTLRSWGFSDPAAVKVYGFGCRPINLTLTPTEYPDDMPQAYSLYIRGRGLAFYGEGPQTWSNNGLPVQNPYSQEGYYFLSDSQPQVPRLEPQATGSPEVNADATTTTFTERLLHEVDIDTPGQSGTDLLGENFLQTRSQTFPFTLTDKASNAVKIQVQFCAHSTTGSGSIAVSANGTTLPSSNTDNLAITTDHYSHGSTANTIKETTVAANELKVGIKFNTQATFSMARLNYIMVSYQRQLRLPSATSTLQFSTAEAATLGGTSAQTLIWDVTNPTAIRRVDCSDPGKGSASWLPGSTVRRSYVAWNPESSTLPAPRLVGTLSPQDLHSLITPDMVIFTPSEWASEAERLADFHRAGPDSLQVLVLTPQQIYDEFASGAPNPMAFRKLLKMLYDHGNAGQGRKLRYALFMSRPTFDYRRITPKVKALGFPMLTAWCGTPCMNDNTAFQSDDPIAFLEDNSGLTMGRDKLSIAIGRLPVTSLQSAREAVDKIIGYATHPGKGNWRNTVVVLGDDGDHGTHMLSADSFSKNLLQAPDGGNLLVRKVYLDAYERSSGTVPGARADLHRFLKEGAAWWTFSGHADTHSLTAEGVMTYTDVCNLSLKYLPLFYGATCDFQRWDNTDFCATEILFALKNGGIPASISTTRPVYINDNARLTDQVGAQIMRRNPDGRLQTIGEIFRNAKNAVAGNNENKLRYTLLGDPAMPTAIPSGRIVIDKINGQNVDSDPDSDKPEIMARQTAEIQGRVLRGDGSTDTDFTGTLTSTLYDAEESFTTLGWNDDDEEITFDRQGARLWAGNDSVRGGSFTMRVAMPTEVANNYRPAAFNLYARGADGSEAVGLIRDFYVFGTDENAAPDSVAPVIEYLVLNHRSFRDGQKVNTTPVVLAAVTDDRAINLSTAGVGHQMQLQLDGGDKVYADVADYYTPHADGVAGGTITYPLPTLTAGEHTLRLRVWDTSGNSVTEQIAFTVAPDVAPKLYDVYTDSSPASIEANFYVTHDRPDGDVTVTIEVFNLLGRRLWNATQTSRSDLCTSAPLTWDLTDNGGGRVPRGIYLYRATITDSNSGQKHSTATRKLAVAAN